MEGNGPRPVPLEVVLGENAGTWKMMAGGSAQRNNPCIGKELPVVVESSTADTLVLDVKGDQVIAGCMHAKVTLTRAGDEFKGTTAGGRGVTLARK